MLPQSSPTEVETGLGRRTGLLCGSSISEHSQEFQSPKQKALKASHQLEGEVAPLFLKQFLSTGPRSMTDTGGATLNKSAMVPPTALASDQISDHFLPQNLSSRKTPTGKKIFRVISTEAKIILRMGRLGVKFLLENKPLIPKYAPKRSPVLGNQNVHLS